MGLGVYLTDQYRMPLWDWDPSGQFNREDAYLLEYKDQKTFRRALTKSDRRGPTGMETTGPHVSEIFADSAIRFLENEQTKPFFMYLAFPTPHDPRQAPQKYRDLYPPDKIELPPSYRAQHPFDNGHLVLRDELLAPWPRTPEIVRRELADYYAIISHLDAQIARVIKALRMSGAYDNTLIIFAGDSGLAVGCHGLLGKQSVYDEDGVHVPFIISGPLAKDKGRKIDAMCYIHDIFPTVCDLTGIPKPSSVTGMSLLPVIDNETKQMRDYTYHAYMQFQRAYRKGDHKLIEYVRADGSDKKTGPFTRGSRVTQLFNYKEDPWETFNLAVFPENQELLKSMQQEMRHADNDLGDNKATTGETYDFWDYFN